MVANIQQNVVTRHRNYVSLIPFRSRSGLWITKSLSLTRLFRRSPGRSYPRGNRFNPRGQINNSTVLISLSLIALLIVSTLGFLYLQQVLRTASSGTDIQALELKIIELDEQQRELELDGATIRTLRSVEERVKHLNLSPTETVTYLVPIPDRVAANVN